MLDRLKRWFHESRHISALNRRDLIVVTRQEYDTLCLRVHELTAWVMVSGAINDGSTPRHTRKQIAKLSGAVLDALPQEKGA